LKLVLIILGSRLVLLASLGFKIFVRAGVLNFSRGIGILIGGFPFESKRPHPFEFLLLLQLEIWEADLETWVSILISEHSGVSVS